MFKKAQTVKTTPPPGAPCCTNLGIGGRRLGAALPVGGVGALLVVQGVKVGGSARAARAAVGGLGRVGHALALAGVCARL